MGKSPDEKQDRFAEASQELEELDLLSAPGASPSQSLARGLAQTTEAFQIKIARRKKDLEKRQSGDEEQTRVRHLVILQTLVGIRRSLTDVTRIDLGKRFSLHLLSDDWQGWPRLSLFLHDDILQEKEYPTFRVMAHDRHETANVEIAFGSPLKTEILSLDQISERKRLVPLLKKCVREYLDQVVDLTFAAEQVAASEQELAKHLKNLDQSHEQQSTEDTLIRADVFAEHSENENYLESLPALDEVDTLLPDETPSKNS